MIAGKKLSTTTLLAILQLPLITTQVAVSSDWIDAENQGKLFKDVKFRMEGGTGDLVFFNLSVPVTVLSLP